VTWPRFVDPPAPPEGTKWCQACLYRQKGRLLVGLQDQIEKLLADGQDQAEKWFPWDKTAKLYPATHRGLAVQMQHLGEMDVCFSCLAGFSVERVSPLDPRGGIELPPGFKRGFG
jgi:hypothetical protein